MSNYFNSLNESEKKSQLSKCRFMNIDEFQNENNILKKKILSLLVVARPEPGFKYARFRFKYFICLKR